MMKNYNLLQKIGFGIFAITFIGRIFGRLFNDTVPEWFSDIGLVGYLGFVLWMIGFGISGYKKRRVSQSE